MPRAHPRAYEPSVSDHVHRADGIARPPEPPAEISKPSYGEAASPSSRRTPGRRQGREAASRDQVAESAPCLAMAVPRPCPPGSQRHVQHEPPSHGESEILWPP
jgi:hypothetical protein